MFANLYADELGTKSDPPEPTEPQIAIAYSVEGLPVWRLEDGQPRFDATVVAHLQNYVDASTHIVSSNEHRSIVVVTSQQNHDIVRRVLSPLGAFGGDTTDRLQRKIETARVANQKILLLAADPNSIAAKQFFDLKFSDDHRQLQELLDNFILQCVPNDKQEATLAILDDSGELVAQVAFANLESSNRGLDDGLVEFLESNRPEFADARESLSAACEQANREQKHVLLVLSGPNCGPCLELARFLEAQHELITRDYVCVKLETRMPHVSEVIQGIRSEGEGPVPWMAVLAADGTVLASSNGPDGNIGYPRTKQSKEHFRKMLSTTAQRLTADELATIIEGLGSTVELESALAPSALK